MFKCVIHDVERVVSLGVPNYKFTYDLTIGAEENRGKITVASLYQLGYYFGDGDAMGCVSDYELMERFEMLAALTFKYDVDVSYKAGLRNDEYGVLIRVYDKENGMLEYGEWFVEETIKKLGSLVWQWKLAAVSKILYGYYYPDFAKRVSEREKIGEN